MINNNNNNTIASAFFSPGSRKSQTFFSLLCSFSASSLSPGDFNVQNPRSLFPLLQFSLYAESLPIFIFLIFCVYLNFQF